MTVGQSLKSLSAYPIPPVTLQDIAEGCGLATETILTMELRTAREFRRAQALTFLFLAGAPAVSQGGQNYSFSSKERELFKARANGILEELEDAIGGTYVAYGYRGEDL